VGSKLNAAIQVEGLSRWLEIPAAVEVLPPRPRILVVKLSLPESVGVELAPGELPLGAAIVATVRAEPLHATPILEVSCVERDLALQTIRARPGETSSGLHVRSSGPGELFLSLDAARVGQPGCRLQVILETPMQGRSDPYELGRLVAVPRIERFHLTAEQAGPGRYIGVIEGSGLEVIERVGWTAEDGMPVTELPVPVSSDGLRQRLRVVLPWPSPEPHAPLYIWLRGDTRGRATSARY